MDDNKTNKNPTVEDLRESVLETVLQDAIAADFNIGIFSAALLSYRKNTCLRPSPDLFGDSLREEEDRLDKLVSIFANIPPLKDLEKSTLSEETWKLLYWILKRKYHANLSRKDTLQEIFGKTGESSFALQPCQIYEINYTSQASERFDELKKEYGLKYGYHGSRLDNFYSIINNGLQVHMMKNGLFGEGVYLTDDLSVTMPYTKSGVIWDHSNLGDQVSCVAFCELIDHPGVKCQTENDTSKTRATAKNSESGEVPDRYYVVTNSELVRVKYILVFSTQKANKRLVKKKQWICSQYPVLAILGLYLLFLICMGIWKSRSFQLFYRRHFFDRDDYDSDNG